MVFLAVVCEWFRQSFTNRLDVYTDGSLKLGRGAWAFVVVQKNQTLMEHFGTERNTTSNRMEFQAAIEALSALSPKQRLRIHTDSRVLLEALKKIPSWKQQGWIKKNSAPIPSVDQMMALDQLLEGRRVEWKWVKAHSGIPFNERCDELCALAVSHKISTASTIP